MSNGEIRVSITEIPKIREALEKADKEIERLHSIIKEVREYIENQNRFIEGCDINLTLDKNKLLEILDKVEEKK